MALRIVEGDRAFEVLPGGKELTHPIRGCSPGQRRVCQSRWIVGALCPQELLGKLIGRPKLASVQAYGPHSEQGGEKLRGIAQPVTKLPRASVSAVRFRRGPPFDCD